MKNSIFTGRKQANGADETIFSKVYHRRKRLFKNMAFLTLTKDTKQPVKIFLDEEDKRKNIFFTLDTKTRKFYYVNIIEAAGQFSLHGNFLGLTWNEDTNDYFETSYNHIANIIIDVK